MEISQHDILALLGAAHAEIFALKRRIAELEAAAASIPSSGNTLVFPSPVEDGERDSFAERDE